MEKKSLGVAIGPDGKPMQFTANQVDDVVARLKNEGTLIIALFRKGDDVGAIVPGGPNPEIPEMLEFIASAYRKALQCGPQEGS